MIKKRIFLRINNMTLYSCKPCLPYLSLFLQHFLIQFSYFLPDDHADWENPWHGKIDILSVELLANNEILDLNQHSLELRRLLRHACWNYLEENKLFKVSNIIPFFQYPAQCLTGESSSHLNGALIIPWPVNNN